MSCETLTARYVQNSLTEGSGMHRKPSSQTQVAVTRGTNQQACAIRLHGEAGREPGSGAWCMNLHDACA